MIITKDEARILAGALKDFKFDLESHTFGSREEYAASFKELSKLEERLDIAGKDQRRTGRKSHNSFTDTLKRYKSK